MPVNIDTVYQTVQALANKEQRGYLTPQEFNLFANQAQADIFEQYFYDLNAFRAARPEQSVIGDSVSMIMEKLKNTGGVTVTNTGTVTGGTDLPPGRTGRVFVDDTNGDRRTLRMSHPDEIRNLRGSKWHEEAFDEIVFFEDGDGRIQVWTGSGQVLTGVTCENVTGAPGICYWGYTVVNEKPLYNPGNSVDFDLPNEERPDLVINILKLAGISIEDQQLAGVAAQEEQMNIQQENK